VALNKMLVGTILVIVFVLILFLVIFPLLRGTAGNIFSALGL
jgi:hypothetical protein